jgi:hypothetical protein
VSEVLTRAMGHAPLNNILISEDGNEQRKRLRAKRGGLNTNNQRAPDPLGQVCFVTLFRGAIEERR